MQSFMQQRFRRRIGNEYHFVLRIHGTGFDAHRGVNSHIRPDVFQVSLFTDIEGVICQTVLLRQQLPEHRVLLRACVVTHLEDVLCQLGTSELDHFYSFYLLTDLLELVHQLGTRRLNSSSTTFCPNIFPSLFQSFLVELVQLLSDQLRIKWNRAFNHFTFIHMRRFGTGHVIDVGLDFGQGFLTSQVLSRLGLQLRTNTSDQIVHTRLVGLGQPVEGFFTFFTQLIGFELTQEVLVAIVNQCGHALFLPPFPDSLVDLTGCTENVVESNLHTVEHHQCPVHICIAGFKDVDDHPTITSTNHQIRLTLHTHGTRFRNSGTAGQTFPQRRRDLVLAGVFLGCNDVEFLSTVVVDRSHLRCFHKSSLVILLAQLRLFNALIFLDPVDRFVIGILERNPLDLGCGPNKFHGFTQTTGGFVDRFNKGFPYCLIDLIAQNFLKRSLDRGFDRVF